MKAKLAFWICIGLTALIGGFYPEVILVGFAVFGAAMAGFGCWVVWQLVRAKREGVL